VIWSISAPLLARDKVAAAKSTATQSVTETIVKVESAVAEPTVVEPVLETPVLVADVPEWTTPAAASTPVIDGQLAPLAKDVATKMISLSFHTPVN
jgi:hypothetical protein